MKCNKLFIGMFIGLFLGSNAIQSFDRVTVLTKNVGAKFDSVSQLLVHSDFKTLAKLSALVFAIKFMYDLTDGKNFNEASSDENMKKALKALTENLGSLDAATQTVKELWYKLIRILRSITGHRPYKIAIKEETITNPDGSKSTKKEEKTVSGTKLCKSIETFIETMYPFIITSSATVLGVRQLAQIIQSGDLFEEGSKLPEIKVK